MHLWTCEASSPSRCSAQERRCSAYVKKLEKPGHCLVVCSWFKTTLNNCHGVLSFMVGVEEVVAGGPPATNREVDPKIALSAGDRSHQLTSVSSGAHCTATSSMGRRKLKNFKSSNPTLSSALTKDSSDTTMHVGGDEDSESMAVEVPLAAEGSLTVESAALVSEPTSSDYYFDSYAHFGIHEEMIKDSVRTKTYQNVIYQNSFLFKDKIVLDVGAGTGILSLFCAKAGARHVYAVECSLMADTAKEIVRANGFSDVITVLKGKVEEIELPTPQVDVIISEWMGYFLLFENMLNTVLYARDKWLVPNGIVLPDKTSLFLTAIEDAEYKQEKIDFWNSVYAFDMSCIRKQAMLEPLVDTVDANQIVTHSQILKTMDISTMTSGDASFSAPFKLVATRNDFIHALVAYFDVAFSKCHKPTGFSTGPKSRPTHWKQTVMYLEDVITICEGEALTGSLSVAPNANNPRDLDVTLQYAFKGKRCRVNRTQYYRMR